MNAIRLVFLTPDGGEILDQSCEVRGVDGQERLSVQRREWRGNCQTLSNLKLKKGVRFN